MDVKALKTDRSSWITQQGPTQPQEPLRVENVLRLEGRLEHERSFVHRHCL